MAVTKIKGYVLIVKWGNKLIRGLITNGLKLKPNYEEVLLKESEGDPDEEIYDYDGEFTATGQTYERDSGETSTYDDFETLREAAAVGATIAFMYGIVDGKYVSGNAQIIEYSEEGNSKDTGNYSITFKAIKDTVNFLDGSSSYWETRTPSNIILTVISDVSIKVDWTDAEEAADGLHVYFNDVLKDTIPYGVGTSTVSGLTANTTYLVEVKAYEGGIESSAISDSAKTFHVEIGTYITGLVTPLTTDQKTDLNTLVDYWKTGWGVSLLSDKLDFAYILAGETSESSLKNIVKNAHHCTAYNSPPFVALEGFMGNTVNRYIDTNYNPSAQGVRFSLNNASFGIYCRTDIAASITKSSGIDNGIGDLRIWPFRHATTHQQIKINDITTLSAYSTATALGLTSAIRYASNSRKAARNKTLGSNNTTVSTDIPTYDIYLLAYNNSGTPSGYLDLQMSFAFAGRALSQSELDVLFDGFEAYMDANGKGVV